MPIELLTKLLDRVAPRCEITSEIDGEVRNCRRKPVTFCRRCFKELCHDHAETVAMETWCEACGGIKEAEIEQQLREAAKL